MVDTYLIGNARKCDFPLNSCLVIVALVGLLGLGREILEVVRYNPLNYPAFLNPAGGKFEGLDLLVWREVWNWRELASMGEP